MKRSTPLRRRNRLRSAPRRKVPHRCPECKLGALVVVEDLTLPIAVAPGCIYQVDVPRARACPVCDLVFLTPAQRTRAEAEAYRLHRVRVLERDHYTCQRCGRRGGQLEVAHKIGWSRARNPGATKHALEHLEACCLDCHRAEHEWRAA